MTYNPSITSQEYVESRMNKEKGLNEDVKPDVTTIIQYNSSNADDATIVNIYRSIYLSIYVL